MITVEIHVDSKNETDLVNARQKGRELAKKLDFSSCDLTLIATAISELARNIITYAGHGEIILSLIQQDNRDGIVIIASDQGPGIPDTKLAMTNGYSSSAGLGMGLPGVKRLMDDFKITSTTEQGTTVTVKKWRVKVA